MQLYNLHTNSKWQSLPWQIIEKRILIIQKKIYNSSKSCQKDLLYKWQNVLLNCTEIKILAIDHICVYLAKYYSHNSKEIYCINDKLKFFLLKNIFNEYKINRVIQNLLEKIKQHIIYLCIQPEWEARFEPVFNNRCCLQKQYLLQERLVNFINLSQVNIFINNVDKNILYNNYKIVIKYIDEQYTVKKFQSLSYIEYCLKSWINNNFIEELVYPYNIIIELNNKLLYALIYKVICTGIDWFNLKSTVIDSKNKIYNFSLFSCLYYDIYNSSFIYSNKQLFYLLNFVFPYLGLNNISRPFYSYKEYLNLMIFKSIENNFQIRRLKDSLYGSNIFSKILLAQIKYIIYNKNRFGQWRMKKHLSLSRILNYIRKKLLYIYQKFCFFLDLYTLNFIIHKIYVLIVIWIRKKYKKKYIKNLYLINKNFIHKHLLLRKDQIINDICTLKINR